MLRPDRLVALCLLAFSLGYGFLAFNYPLLPFERHTAFKPSTMPMGLAVMAVVLSLAVLIKPGGGGDGLSADAAGWRAFDWRACGWLVLLMLLYALTLRPLGYLAATTLFIFLSAVVLGERKFLRLGAIAAFASLLTWYLVQQVLGVFLKPLPGWLT